MTCETPKLPLRDYFAGQAVSALIARHRADVSWDEIAPIAYRIADAILAERTSNNTECALTKHIAELEAALDEIHTTPYRVTHLHEWYFDGVRQPPGEYIIMRVGNAPKADETPF